MGLLVIKDIVFLNPEADGRTHYQDIVIKKTLKVIGVLVMIDRSILAPIEEIYQRGVKDTPQNRKLPHGESDDKGWIFLKFKTLEDFLSYYNTGI